jgi:hypothetical protein
VKKLVHEHRADDRVTFEVFLPIMQVVQRNQQRIKPMCSFLSYKLSSIWIIIS